ncbi:MAG TPA: helix-turn-helix domain-containing protein [Acetobacteraceae bacterium]
MNVKTPQVIDALGALAHEYRLAIYRLLVERGPEGLPAGVIAERIGLPPSSLTFHVQALQRAGLITQRRASRQLFYATDYSAMTELVGYLTENCCGQNEGGCAPGCQPAGASTKSRKARRVA